MSKDFRRLGQAGETLAAEVLQRRGYTILQRNYRTPYGEIDLVAQQGDALVFIEVKLRRSPRFGSAAEAVTAVKKRRLVEAAALYLQEGGDPDAKLRFDVVAITVRQGKAEVEVFQDAFEAD